MAGNVVRVCAQADIAPETVKAFEVGDSGLAVYNIEGQFYVTDDECTDAAASLADGMLEGDVIECCVHFGAFDVKTGAVERRPARSRCAPIKSCCKATMFTSTSTATPPASRRDR